MMGAHHAMTGAAAWIAVTATAGHGLGFFPVSPAGTVTGALLCAGAALLADADHGSATISRSVPVLGRLVTGGISRASGGHRHGLHGLLAILCAWLLATGLDRLSWQSPWSERPVDVGIAAASAAAIAFAAYALGLAPGSWPMAWSIGLVGAGGITVFAPERPDWFIVCITLGYGVHLLGDLLTTGGLPLLWPWVPKPPRAWRKVPVLNRIWTSGGHLAVPILGNAGSLREWALLIPVTLYVGYGILFAALAEVGVDLAALLY
ncbi:metal-dependent hydrolase [Cryobacterium algoritolerans]|uniref:Metal-dependent hydrolase n=1 Tax=Cryobacterium algoritolerans TaxID=1259184 RepID=A0A4R8WR27_9MICO|nr:metal-dependent hydrolase [Cryobacterium algoritolerans]TFC14571.1 metal-dependent hydrolase [Cryobacterium algoritolerans]